MGRGLAAVGMVLALWDAACGGVEKAGAKGDAAVDTVAEDDALVCPGHLDPMGTPSMQIETYYHSDAIAAAKVVQGPCTAAGSGYSVTIQRTAAAGWSSDEPCTIELVSQDGRCATVTATMEYRQGITPVRHCSDNSNCCPPSEIVSGTFAGWDFTESVMQISFGGAASCAGYDAGAVDAAVVDSSLIDVPIDQASAS